MVIRLPLCVWYIVVLFFGDTFLLPISVSFGGFYFVYVCFCIVCSVLFVVLVGASLLFWGVVCLVYCCMGYFMVAHWCVLVMNCVLVGCFVGSYGCGGCVCVYDIVVRWWRLVSGAVGGVVSFLSWGDMFSEFGVW